MTEPRSTDAPPKRLSILAICKPTASLGEVLASFAPAGNWRTDCVYMRPKEKALGDLFLLRFSEQPGAQFLVSRGQVLEAGQEIVPVLEGWRTHAQKNKVSAEGKAFIQRCLARKQQDRPDVPAAAADAYMTYAKATPE